MRYVAVLIMVILLPGCIGGGYSYVEVIKEEVNDENRHFYRELSADPEGKYKNSPLVKNAKKQWCGAMAFVGIPIPLMLPLCETGTEYVYKNGVLVETNLKTISEKVFICGPFVWVFGIGHGYKDFYFICGGEW